MSHLDAVMTVHAFDFVHDGDTGKYDFSYSEFKYFGGWEAEPYDTEKSMRLIMVARKN